MANALFQNGCCFSLHELRKFKKKINSLVLWLEAPTTMSL